MKLATFFLSLFRKKLPYELHCTVEGEILYAITQGEILDADALLSHARTIDDTLAQHQLNKVYNDLLETNFTTDIVVFADLINAYVKEMELAAKKYKIACLIRREYEAPGRYWETACQNRGIMARVFFEREEALAWLMQ